MNNEMAASCNLESNEWEIQMGKMNVGNISITINFTALQNRIFNSLEFGYNFYVDNVLDAEDEYPKGRMTIQRLLSTYAVSPTVTLQEGKSHRLHFWANVDGDTIEKNISIDNVIYKQPYQSWVLVNGTWQPPVPMPSTQAIWSWNEEELKWISLDFEYSPDAANSSTGPKILVSPYPASTSDDN